MLPYIWWRGKSKPNVNKKREGTSEWARFPFFFSLSNTIQWNNMWFLCRLFFIFPNFLSPLHSKSNLYVSVLWHLMLLILRSFISVFVCVYECECELRACECYLQNSNWYHWFSFKWVFDGCGDCQALCTTEAMCFSLFTLILDIIFNSNYSATVLILSYSACSLNCVSSYFFLFLSLA